MNKMIGCIFVAAGAAIGAGTIALPIAVAGMGFQLATLILIGVWVLSWLAGLLTLEVNLAFRAPRNTYASMTGAILGKQTKWVTYVLFVVFLYVLTSAYISGGSSLVEAGSQLLFHYAFPEWVNTILYTLALGSIVVSSTRSVDLFNRGLFSLKALLLLAIVIVFLPEVNVANLLSQNHLLYAGAGIPVIFAAFGGHIVIPSVTKYMDHHVGKLKAVVLYGSLIPLIVYLIWIACLLGTIPYHGENSLATIASSSMQVETLMYTIDANVHSPTMTLVINLFSHIVIITSFLGCSLSLFDFLRDHKSKKTPPHRLLSAFFTFGPPLLIGLIYPDALVQLLSYASVFSSLLLIVLPACMAWRLRRLKALSSPYRVFGGTPLLVFVAMIGLGIIGAQILRMSGYYAIWMGGTS